MTEKIKIVVTGDSKDAEEALKDTSKEIKNTEKSFSGATAAASALTAAIGVGVVAALHKTIEVSREFDILNAGLKTATGSAEAAAEQFEKLERFAAETPFALQQSVDAFIKLKNFGLDPSERALRSYGDTSSALGKDLNQMIEAVADAATGEFERLKEFGIRSKNQGDTIAFTFKGITTEVENSASAIEEHLISLGENNFAGAMTERMATLDGAISNFSDSWDALFRTIGQSPIGDFIEQGFRGATEAIQELTGYIDDLSGNAAKPINETTDAAIRFGNAQIRIENITNRLNKINSANETTIKRITEARDRQIAVVSKNVEDEQAASAIREKFNAKYQIQIDALEQAQSQSASLLKSQLADEVSNRDNARLALDKYAESARAAHQAEIGEDDEIDDAGLSDRDQKAFERLQTRFMSEQELLSDKLSQEQLLLVDALMAKELTEEEFRARQLYLAAEYENNLAKLNEDGADKRAEQEADVQRRIMALRQGATNAALGLLSALGSKSEAWARTQILVNRGLSIAQAYQNTAVAVTKALAIDPTGTLSARAQLIGNAQIGLIAATGALELGGVGGGSQPSSGGGGSGGGLSTPQAPQFSPNQQQGPREISVTLSGIDDDQIFTGRQLRELTTQVVDEINEGGYQ